MKSKNEFPKEETLKRIRDKLSDPNYTDVNVALPRNASDTDRAKYQICQYIAKYKREHQCLQKEIAEKIGVDESRVSGILLGKIESFTLYRLFDYAKKLYPQMKIEIIAA